MMCVGFSAYLPLHTDNPDFEQPGSLVTLQPLQKAQAGGHSTLVDSFYVAEQLKLMNPKAFELVYNILYVFCRRKKIENVKSADKPKLY